MKNAMFKKVVRMTHVFTMLLFMLIPAGCGKSAEEPVVKEEVSENDVDEVTEEAGKKADATSKSESVPDVNISGYCI